MLSCANNGTTLIVDIFPSNFVEWKPIKAITAGTFQAYHVDLGRLIYKVCLPALLQAKKIFFYEDTYVAPKIANGFGKLVPEPAPTITSVDWLIPNNASVGYGLIAN